MIDLDNQTDLEVNLSALEKIYASLTTAEVELLIVSDDTMQSMNKKHRDKLCSTDVLSFPMDSSFTPESILGFPLGSIVISASFVKEKAKTLEHNIQDELSLLFIHGMLHLLGFDHEKDSGEMREKEEALIKKFDLPKSLIVRTGE
ncbi:MAG: rRNA maturation RNase YbeY [Sulfurovum sp.]|nr:rRNA maturation RNase YbeY [Sulfurovum sp.]